MRPTTSDDEGRSWWLGLSREALSQAVRERRWRRTGDEIKDDYRDTWDMGIQTRHDSTRRRVTPK